MSKDSDTKQLQERVTELENAIFMAVQTTPPGEARNALFKLAKEQLGPRVSDPPPKQIHLSRETIEEFLGADADEPTPPSEPLVKMSLDAPYVPPTVCCPEGERYERDTEANASDHPGQCAKEARTDLISQLKEIVADEPYIDDVFKARGVRLEQTEQRTNDAKPAWARPGQVVRFPLATIYDVSDTHVGIRFADGTTDWRAFDEVEPCPDSARNDGHREDCFYCHLPCNSLAGDPGRWPVGLPHPDAPGVVKWHHASCVMDRLHRTEPATPNDEALADTVISRLNALVGSPAVRADIARLIECRVPASPETAAHETIQVTCDDQVGLLGVLNGIIGVIREGENAGAGYIGAEFDDNGVLARFVRTGASGPA